MGRLPGDVAYGRRHRNPDVIGPSLASFVKDVVKVGTLSCSPQLPPENKGTLFYGLQNLPDALRQLFPGSTPDDLKIHDAGAAASGKLVQGFRTPLIPAKVQALSKKEITEFAAVGYQIEVIAVGNPSDMNFDLIIPRPTPVGLYQPAVARGKDLPAPDQLFRQSLFQDTFVHYSLLIEAIK